MALLTLSLLSLFQWLGQSWLGAAMQQSTWGFAVVEMVHLLALAALGGAVLIVDLNLLGLGMRKQSASSIAHEVSPMLFLSLAVLTLSGIVLVSEEAVKCYFHPAFRAKMMLLAVAILFHVTLHRKVVGHGDRIRPVWKKSAGALSLTLWLSVGLAGRAIGFV